VRGARLGGVTRRARLPRWCSLVERGQRHPELGRQDTIGQQGHGRVVEAGPTALFETVEAEFVFDLLVASFDLPALYPPAYRLVRVGERLDGDSVAPAMGWPDPHPGELGLQPALGAFPSPHHGLLQARPPIVGRDQPWSVVRDVSPCARAVRFGRHPRPRRREHALRAEQVDDIGLRAGLKSIADEPPGTVVASQITEWY
jgi:hypothetical protein